MFHIRLAKLSDAPELQKLNDLFNGEGTNSLEDISETLKTNTLETVCVADDRGRLAGFCCGQVCKSICCPILYAEITELFVMREYRRQGLGKQLLRYMETELINSGVRHFHILTSKDKFVAQALYHSFGFLDTSEMLLEKNV